MKRSRAPANLTFTERCSALPAELHRDWRSASSLLLLQVHNCLFLFDSAMII